MMKEMRWESAGVVTVPHQAEPKHTDSLRSPQSFNNLQCQPGIILPIFYEYFTKIRTAAKYKERKINWMWLGNQFDR